MPLAPKMAAEENKQVIRKYLAAMNEGDAGAAVSLWADDPVNHGQKREHQEVLALHENLMQIYERLTLYEMVAEGEWVACRIMAQGRHKSQPRIPFDSGIYRLTKPDGRPFSFQHIHLFRVVDGKIKEHWANRDDLGAARQLGLELAPKETK